MPWPDATDEVRALIEILHSRLAHHREAALQVNQILSAEHHARRPGTAGHDREMVSRWENIRPLSPLQETPRDVPCKTRGQDGFATSFPVRLLHTYKMPV